MALEIVANYLRLNGLGLMLTEPCFDNLPDMFRRHGLTLESLDDSLYASPELSQRVAESACGALCIVTPNNPTGATLNRQQFRNLADTCAASGKVLIIDSSFRLYTPAETVYDQYAELINSGAKFVCVEDTGKVWPSLELKAPFLAAHPNLFDPLYDIYTDFILHVSPFTLELLTRLVEHSTCDGLRSVRAPIERNRRRLKLALENSPVKQVEAPFMSVSWLQTGPVPGERLVRTLSRKGVHVLAGERFFWSNGERGQNHVRVALARDPRSFDRAALVIGEECRSLDDAQGHTLMRDCQ